MNSSNTSAIELQNVLDGLPGAVSWKSKDGVYRGCNRSFLELVGLPMHHDLIGKTDYDLCWKEQADVLCENDKKVIRQEKSEIFRETVLLANGGVSVYLCTRVPLRDEKNEITGVVCTAVDVSAFPESAEALQESNIYLAQEKACSDKKAKKSLENLEKIISCMPGSVYWKDIDGVYIGCNDAMANMLNLRKEDVIGKTDYYLLRRLGLSEEQIKTIIATDAEIMQSGAPRFHIEEPTFTCENGDTINQISNKVPIFDEDTRLVGLVGISIDITQQKKLERELSALQLREERLQTLSSVGAMIAHELRTPLTTVHLAASAITDHLPILLRVYGEWSTEKQQHLIPRARLRGLDKICDDIMHALSQAEHTIDMVLHGFRPHAVAEQEWSLVCLKDFMHTFLSHYPLSPQQAGYIQLQITPDLRVWCNPRVLTYVLNNLIKNALYFIEEVGKGSITVSATQDDTSVYLHIRDTAKGIPKEQIQRIFEPFYTSKKVSTSIGMGLYFCKLAMESMDAGITCDSVYGEFTEFVLTMRKKSANNDSSAKKNDKQSPEYGILN